MVVDWFRRLPWWATASLVALWAIGTASFAFYFTSDLFHETCLNERNLLTGELEPSNCGEGAKLAQAPADQPAAKSSASAASTDKASAAPTTPVTDVPMASDGTPTPTPTRQATNAPASTATEAPSSEPTNTPEPTQPPAVGRPGVLARGTFEDGEPGHDGSGLAEIQRLADGSYNLFLSEFSVTNGPDLFIVLTRDPGGDYADGDLVLEMLKANNGNQNYSIPAGIDLSQYAAVMIWCRQFDVNFAFAPLGGVQ